MALGVVQGESGQYYLHSEDIHCQQNCWQKVNEKPAGIANGSPAQELNCLSHPNLDKFVEVRGVCTYYFYSTKLEIWAIDSQGQVHFCQNWQPNDLQHWMVNPLNGAGVGLLFGIFLVVCIDQRIKWKGKVS